MAELSRTNREEVHHYTGNRDMVTGRKMRIKFTDAGADETVFNEICPSGESWTIKFSIVKIIHNN